MVSLQNIRTHNASLKELGPGLVAVFVGGTSGIGESTAREFVRHTLSPRVYLVGRNETQASRIIDELHALNADGKVSFIKSDVSLLRSVDAACTEITSKESKVNLLFMSAGILTTKGRNETIEGLDKKLSLHYYSRMRFAQNLLPQLSAAADSGQKSRVISVLSAGGEGALNLDDLSLKTNYSLANAATHAITMNSLSMMQLAASNPTLTFIHTVPGAVATNILRDFNPVVRGLTAGLTYALGPFLKSWVVPLGESGERHLYAATSPTFPPRQSSEKNANSNAATGADGVPGSGVYLLHCDGSTPNKTQKLLMEYQESGVGKKVWEHTLDVFGQITGKDGGRYL